MSLGTQKTSHDKYILRDYPGQQQGWSDEDFDALRGRWGQYISECSQTHMGARNRRSAISITLANDLTHFMDEEIKLRAHYRLLVQKAVELSTLINARPAKIYSKDATQQENKIEDAEDKGDT